MTSLEAAVVAADVGLHPWVREVVPEADRRAHLREELAWAVDVATSDLAFAASYAARQPQSGQPPAAYLDRWLEVAPDLAVLTGPRYRGLRPDAPFVAVDAASRPVVVGDLPALRSLVAREYAPFAPLDVRLWTSDPAGTWPGTSPDTRDVVGRLGDLRARSVPPGIGTRPAVDLGWCDRYAAEHARHVARDPGHADRSRTESREDLADLVAAGTVHEVLVDGAWAGVLVSEPGVRHGLRGHVVVELLLAAEHRGRGLGRHLGPLLVRSLDAPDGSFLLGQVHHANAPAYRSALAAGRRDVGGEVVVALPPPT